MVLDIPLLSSIARQMMNDEDVEINGKRIPVGRTSRQGLRALTFSLGGREYAAIEQNPDKPSRWGKLAREGHQVVQFKDVLTNRFVVVAVAGEAKEYGRTGSRGTKGGGGDVPDPEQYLQFRLLPSQTQGFIYVTRNAKPVCYRGIVRCSDCAFAVFKIV